MFDRRLPPEPLTFEPNVSLEPLDVADKQGRGSKIGSGFEESWTMNSRARLREHTTQLLTFAVILSVVIGGAVANYRLSQYSERQSGLAIDTYNLHGDLRQIVGDLAISTAQRSGAVESDLRLAVADAQRSIAAIESAGPFSANVSRATNTAASYLDSVVSDLKSGSTAVGGAASGPGDHAADLVDGVAGNADQQSSIAASESRDWGLGVLLFVALEVGVGLLWWSRERRREAITATMAAEREQFEAMIEKSSDLFFLTGADNRTSYCSPSAARFLGMTADEVCTTPFSQFIHSDDLDRTADMFAAVHANGTAQPFDVRIRHADGGWRTLEVTGDDLSRSTSVNGIAWHSRDVTDRRALEEQLERQAFEDSLTGLANRALFRNRLALALARAGRSPRALAVLMLDLDGFKAINDTMGHDAGDAALREVAARLALSARPGDTIARLGGDEFAVLLDELSDEAFAGDIAERILEIIRQPLEIEDTFVNVSASIGIAFANTPEMTSESLLRDADTALYAAKGAGRDRAVRFDPAMHARAAEQLRLSQDLKRSIKESELSVVYQPCVDLEHDVVEGVEALVRWHHHDLGLIMPADFIPIAEQNGFIVSLGRWVLEQACDQAAAWRSSILDAGHLTMAVNVSGYQLNHPSLVPDVRRIIESSGIAPGNLILEVTESVLMADIDLVIEQLRKLKELGIAIAIDDFGTGYSSLSYLRKLPIDILKIDKSFVDAATAGEPGGDAILHAIINLSTGLHLRTIAEGIERSGQAQHLRELGCQSAQGFFFARPMVPSEVESLISSTALSAVSH